MKRQQDGVIQFQIIFSLEPTCYVISMKRMSSKKNGIGSPHPGPLPGTSTSCPFLPSLCPCRPRTTPASAKHSWCRSSAPGTCAAATVLMQVPVSAPWQKCWHTCALWHTCNNVRSVQGACAGHWGDWIALSYYFIGGN